MNKDAMIDLAKRLIQLLVDEQYVLVYEGDIEKRASADMIQHAIEEYPGKLTIPPDAAFEKMDVYDIKGNDNMKEVEIDLWYDNKRSDLTLSFRVLEEDKQLSYTIDDIHIL